MRKRLVALALTATVGVGAAGGLAAWSIYHTFGLESRAYIFANWENYMSPGLQKYLADKYDVGFTNYGTNSDLIGLYTDGSYDAAIPSDYLIPQLVENNALRQIDWSQFDGHGLTMLAPQEMAEYYDYDAQDQLVGKYPLAGTDGEVKPVVDNDPINLFNDIVKKQIVQFRGFDGAQTNLLKYGVPYFMQDLVFAYRGAPIPELADETQSYTWKDILTRIGNFNNNLEIIDDERNVYSIGRSINTEDGADGSTINPNGSQDTNLDPAFRSFNEAVKPAGKILWDTDSYGVLNYLSKWQDGDAPRAAILYNGDAVYAAQGGEIGSGNQPAATFHVIHPKTTVFVMDMITISSKTNAAKLPGLMKMINELALSGMMVNADNPDYQNGSKKINPDIPWASLVGDEGYYYENMSMQNFNNVNYVSVSRDMDLVGSDYFSDSDEYEYTDDAGSTQTIFGADLYTDDDENYYEYASATAPGPIADDDYAGPFAYESDGKYYAATPTGNNAKLNIYKLKVEDIVSKSIEAPFTDSQQTASLRYFYDLKQRLD